MNTSNASIAKSRLKFIFILFLFFGPLIASFIWYYGFGAVLAPKGESNHAPLVTPVVALDSFSNSTYEGSEITGEDLKKQWTIVHILPSLCDEQCKLAMYHTRQTRVAVGKDAHRVSRVLITDDDQFVEELGFNHADAAILKPGDNGLEKQLLRVRESSSAGPNDGVLIDPLGNAMMIVPLDLDPKLLLKDLKKLLKLSHIG